MKFTPPEASQESQEMGNEAIRLMQEVERRREQVENLGREAAELASRLEDAETRLRDAETAKDVRKILLEEVEPLQMELSQKLAEKRRLGIEKLALASDLMAIRESKFGGEIQMPEPEFSAEERSWLARGEKMSAVMENIAKIREEDSLVAEEEFFAKAA